MKKLFVFFILFVSIKSIAQDTIRCRDGRVFECTINSVDSSTLYFTFIHNNTNVKTTIDRQNILSFYKKPSSVNIPKDDYEIIIPESDSIALSSNFRVSIKNGRMLSYKDFMDTLLSNPKSALLAKKANRNLKIFSWTSLYGAVFIGYGFGFIIGNAIGGNPVDWPFFCVYETFGITFYTLSLPFKKRAKKLFRQSVNEFNYSKGYNNK